MGGDGSSSHPADFRPVIVFEGEFSTAGFLGGLFYIDCVVADELPELIVNEDVCVLAGPLCCHELLL